MPVTDAYSDATTYRARIGRTDAASDVAILADLVAVSRYIDRAVGRFFTKDAVPVARVTYPRGYHQGDPEAENPWRGVRGGRVLDVMADMSALPTSVVIDLNRTGTFVGYTALVQPDASGVTGGDYQLLPLNADKGPEPKPWTQLYIPTWSTQFGWPPGCPVQVTCAWGFPAIPNAIARATEQLTAILRLENPRATAQIPEDMNSTFGASPKAKSIIADILRTYERPVLFA